MTNICIYISDYGYGHAARDIAIIRRLLKEFKDIKIYVKTNGPFHFVRDSLPQKNVEVMQTQNDIGLIFEGSSITVDRERTKEVLDTWLSSWDEYIQKERRFCEAHNINVIPSDITPQPFIVADELGISSIAISNFTWHYIFYNLFRDIPATEQIKEAYQHADLALVLPFNEKMDLFKKRREISLVSRDISEDRNAMRRKCGIPEEAMLIYIGVGRSLDSSFLSSTKSFDTQKTTFLVSSNVESSFENIVRIPSNESETQNYIAMCDLVVSKAGYSTASEAIRAKVPLFMFKREGYKEDELIAHAIGDLGIGWHISENAFLNGNWVNELDNLEVYKSKFDTLDGRFKNDGTIEVLETKKEVAL